MFYKEDRSGQILQEGINEPGAMSSWIAAATSYSNSDAPMIPFYIYYSMFGFQRVGDLAWAAGDMRARGFLLGGTAGRTTLNGEGLQHEDGHSHILSSPIPNCVSYDPTFAYEVAVIIQDGLRRMYAEQEDVFYYLTVMNENYEHPAMPEGAAWPRGSSRGCTCSARAARPKGRGKARPRVQLLGSGTILREVIAGGRPAGRGLRGRRRHLERAQLHRAAPRGAGRRALEPAPPDRAAADQLRDQLPGRPAGPGGRGDRLHQGLRRPDPPVRARARYKVLGTDGFGRSDYRAQAAPASSRSTGTTSPLAALAALAEEGTVPAETVAEAIAKYGIDPEKPNPARQLTRTSAEHLGRSEATVATTTEVTVPDIGDFKDVPVIEVHVAPGDVVAEDDPLSRWSPTRPPWTSRPPPPGRCRSVRSRSATRSARAPPILVARRRRRRAADHAAEPDRPAGAATRGDPGEPGPRPAPAAQAPAAARGGPRPGRGDRRRHRGPRQPQRAPAGPRARRRPRPPSRARGEKGRITKEDVLAFRARPGHGGPGAPPRRAPASPRSRPRTSPSSARSRRSRCPGSRSSPGPFLHRSWLNVPHVTHNDEADITELDAYRKRARHRRQGRGLPGHAAGLPDEGRRLGAASQFPEVNSSLSPEKDSLILKRYYHIGIAVDTPGRPGRAGDPRRRPQGHHRAEPGARRDLGRRPATASSRPATCRAAPSPSPASAASAAPASPRSSTRPRWRSSAWSAPETAPVWDGEAFVPAPDAAALAVLRPPGHRRRAGRPVHPAPVPPCSRTSAAWCCEPPTGRDRSCTMSTPIEIRVPDIGDFNDVPVIEVHVAPGEPGRGRRPADHAGVRQGDHGRARPRRPARWRELRVGVGDRGRPRATCS